MGKETETFWDNLPSSPGGDLFGEVIDAVETPAETTDPGKKAEEKKVEKPESKAEEKPSFEDEGNDEGEDEEGDVQKKKSELDSKKTSEAKPGSKKEDSPDDTPADTNLYEAAAETFQEAGIFIKTDKPPKNLEELLSLAEETVAVNTKLQVKEIFKNLPDDVAEYAKHRIAGGDPKAFFTDSEIPDFDLTKEEGQVAAIRFQKKREGESDDDIDALIANYKAKDTLGDKAKIAEKKLKEVREGAKKKREESFDKVAYKSSDDLQKDMVSLRKKLSTVKEVDGKEVNDKEVLSAVNYALKPIEKNGEITTAFDEGLLELIDKNPKVFFEIIKLVQSGGVKKANSSKLDAVLKKAVSKGDKVDWFEKF